MLEIFTVDLSLKACEYNQTVRIFKSNQSVTNIEY